MSKKVQLAIIFALFAAGCNQVEAPTQNTYVDETQAPDWNGPGIYWGVFIFTQSQYWNHYNHRYYRDQPAHHDGRGRSGRSPRGDHGEHRGGGRR